MPPCVMHDGIGVAGGYESRPAGCFERVGEHLVNARGGVWGIRMSRPSTGLVLRAGLRGVLLLVTAAILVPVAPDAARATHERAALITWSPTTGNSVEFTITGAWRRSASSTANCRCRDPNDTISPVLGSIPCTGAGGFAGVGDVIVELQ